MQADISCESYRFKPTLQEDMARADLVISHAGAGSIMEALGALSLAGVFMTCLTSSVVMTQGEHRTS